MQHLSVDLVHDLGDFIVNVLAHAFAQLIFVFARLLRLDGLL